MCCVLQDDDEDAEEEDDCPALAASQSLDILALNLPPEKYMAALLAQVPSQFSGLAECCVEMGSNIIKYIQITVL